jgi:hypothetical protein
MLPRAPSIQRWRFEYFQRAPPRCISHRAACDARLPLKNGAACSLFLLE